MNEPFRGINTPPIRIVHPTPGKQINVDPALLVKEKSGLRRHVEWLNQGTGFFFGCKRILAWTERIFFDLTILLAPVVRSNVAYAKRFRAEVTGRNYLEMVNKSGKQSPAKDFEPNGKSQTQAMNHTTCYVIKEDVIWYKPLNDQKAEWKVMPFPTNRIPIKISVDGANLCVEDDQHDVHYRKVLREAKREGRTDGEDQYTFREKSERNNFKQTWFTLPVISTLLKPFVATRLRMQPDDTLGWAISHRGQFNHFIEDAASQRHAVGTGVTTLYKLERCAPGSDEARNVVMFDPWKPEWVRVSIPMPETSSSHYRALNFDVASSTLMTIGRETVSDSAGETTQKLSIKTLLADLDGLGWNPGLKFDYVVNPTDKDVRVLNQVAWRDHQLPSDPGDRLTSQISILQTGEGNNARELRVNGMHDNQTGFFYKALTDDHWRFMADPSLQIPEESFLATDPQALPERPQYLAKNYEIPRYNLVLKDFTLDKVSSTMTIDGHELMVYRRVSIVKKAIGKTGESFDIVVPKDAPEGLKAKVREIFGAEQPRGVRIELLANRGLRVSKSRDKERGHSS